MRRTPLDVVEELAVGLFGPGSAISLDRVSRGTPGYVATVWDPKGADRLACRCATRHEAIVGLRRALEEVGYDS